MAAKSIRDAMYAGYREGLRKHSSGEPKKKKTKQLSEAELNRLRRVLAKQKVSEELY